MPVLKKSATCEFSHIWHLPSTTHYCWSVVTQAVLQVGKQVVVTQSEIRSVRSVEVLQQRWSASSCMRMCVVMASTTLDVSIQCLLFWMALRGSFSVLQYTSDITVVPYCMYFTCALKVIISFLSDICLNFFGVFGECVYIHCCECSFVLTFTNEPLVLSPFTLMM
jgi:hypothetical protein